jgi:nitroreductase
MDFFDAIRNRRSVRSFKAQEVPVDLLAKILDAARLAPSALNEQPWEFVVIAGLAKRRQIRVLYEAARSKSTLYKQDTAFLENATLILACTHSDSTRDIISVSLAIENLLLAATALGLGSLIMTTAVSTEEQLSFFRRECNIPTGVIPLALIATGYTAEPPPPKEKRTLNDIMHLEKI